MGDGVQSVERAVALVEVLSAASGPLALGALAERAGLAPGTAHRLLRTLGAAGWVRQDGDRRYALGTALVPLGAAATRTLGSGAAPYLSELVEAFGETANLAVLDEDDRVVYVAQVPGRHRMRMFTEVGRRVLPHSAAVGKVLLAWRPEEEVRTVLARHGLPARTENTVTDVAALLEQLRCVRERGWALDDEEEELGVRCVAVPVGPGERARTALSVSGPAVRLTPCHDALLALLRDVAARMASTVVGA